MGENMMISEQTENVVNAFDNVIKVYTETSFLLKSFADVMQSHDMLRVRQGNAVSITTSKSIERPEEWLPPFAGLKFRHKEETKDSPRVAVVAAFLGVEEKWTPCLFVGVIGAGMNIEPLYRYLRDKKEEFVQNADNIAAVSTERGVFKALPLLQVSDESVVKGLAEWAIGCWKEKHGKIK
ncbi:MAG: hypothetical protein MPK09_02940 [Gammaproteobacteria bacterium]|nr:hypothetical protein [Gammaproteobacteria bacterium]